MTTLSQVSSSNTSPINGIGPQTNSLIPLPPHKVTNLFNNQMQSANNTTHLLTANQNHGEAFVAKCIELERATKNTHLVIPNSDVLPESLRLTYGDAIVNRILERYGFTKNTSFTLTEFKAIMIGIAAGVERSDLEARFEDLKKKGDPALSQFKSFDEVTDVHIGRLRDDFIKPAENLMQIKKQFAQSTAMRVLSIVAKIFIVLAALALISFGIFALVAPMPGSSLLGAISIAAGAILLSTFVFTSLSSATKTKYHDPLEQDTAFIKSCFLTRVFNFNHNQHIAASEYLAHDMAYADLREGQVIPLKEKDSHFTFVKVSKGINKEGYVCFILTPLQEKMHKDNFQVRILFRGTHDIKSLRRLSEPYSAGHLSFKHHQKELLESIHDVIPADATHVHTEYFGHSLGGADAQRAVALTKLAQTIINAPKAVQADEAEFLKRSFKHFEGPEFDKISATFKKIDVIKGRVWNSAGVTNGTNAILKKSFEIDEKYNLNNRVVTVISECKVDGDWVQRSGQKTLGHGFGKQHPLMHREVYQFDHGHGGFKGFLLSGGLLATAKAHQVKNLNKDSNKGKDPKFSHATNVTNLAAVEKSSGDHFTWPGELWQKIKMFIMHLLFGSSLNYKGQFYNAFALPAYERA